MLQQVKKLRILALCGSLRRVSINRALLEAFQEYVREHTVAMEVELFEQIGELALFNPDYELNKPAPVLALHDAIARSDLVVIASPEYAHGLTGVMKNALDWCVSLEAFVNKPVFIMLARSRSTFADAALHEVLRTMSARVVSGASFDFDLQPQTFTRVDMLQSPRVRQQLAAVVGLLESNF